MKKQMIVVTVLIGLGLAACQMDLFSPESTPIIIPTRLILPTPTLTLTPNLPPASVQTDSGPIPDQPGPLLTAVPSITASPLPTIIQVGKYASKARGVELNESTLKVDPAKLQADFGVIHGGQGWSKPYNNYGANLQALDQANIPCLLLWDIIIPPELDASRPDKSFPPENEEPNVAAIIRATKNKPVAGIIVRFLDKDTPEHKVFTQGWMANYITFIVNAVDHTTGKPLFVMTSQAFIDGFGSAEDLNRVVSNLDGMSSWKAAAPEKTPQLASWIKFPLPPDDYVPEYISGNDSLYFINYARAAWKFDGIDAVSTPLWLYIGSPDQLKKDLEYKDHASNTPGSPTPGS